MEKTQNATDFDQYKDIRAIIEDIRVNFLFMTKEVLMKTNRFINKQIIDSIKNYFFENQIGSLLKPKMEKDSLKKVKSEIEDNIKFDPDNKYSDPEIPKYMIFMNAYIDQIEKFGLHQDYQNLLYDIILSDNIGGAFSDDWMTLARKKITAVLLLGHFQFPNKQNLKNIFDLWANMYPNQQLNKVKKNFKNSKQNTANPLPSQEKEKQDGTISSSSSLDSENSETEENEELQKTTAHIVEVISEKGKKRGYSKSSQRKNPKQDNQINKPKTPSTRKQIKKGVPSLEISQIHQNQDEKVEFSLQQDLQLKQADTPNKVPKQPKSKRQHIKKEKASVTSNVELNQEVLGKEAQMQKLPSKLKEKKKGLPLNQYSYISNDNDETSFSPLMQGAQVETYIAETQFIIDHEEDEKEDTPIQENANIIQQENNENDDGEETNPQNYNRQMSIIPRRTKNESKIIKNVPQKIKQKLQKLPKMINCRVKKQSGTGSQILQHLDSMNHLNQINEEKTTALCQNNQSQYQDFDNILINNFQNYVEKQDSPTKTYSQSIINQQQLNEHLGILEEQQSNYYYNYQIISSQMLPNANNNNTYNNNNNTQCNNQSISNFCTNYYGFSENSQLFHNPAANNSNQLKSQSQLEIQQQNLQIPIQTPSQASSHTNNTYEIPVSSQTNQLLYNKITTSNQQQQYTNHSQPINIYSNINNLNADYDQQFSSYTNYPSQNFNSYNQSLQNLQQTNQHQTPVDNDNQSKEEAIENQQTQQFSPIHQSEIDTIQNKHYQSYNYHYHNNTSNNYYNNNNNNGNQHQETYNQDFYQEYLNFDQDNLNQNFCFSFCDIVSHDNQENFFKYHQDADYSQDFQVENKKNSSNQFLHKQLQQIQEEQTDKQNNQMSLETRSNINQNDEDSQPNIEAEHVHQQNHQHHHHHYHHHYHHQYKKDLKKSESRKIELEQRLEDKTEITITQDKQSEEIESSLSDKSFSEDLYKETISVDDQEDSQQTQSF